MYHITITLDNITPPISRTVSVPEEFTLYKLHQVVQAAMGWTNSHLYQFMVGNTTYGDPKIWEDPDMVNDKKILIKDLLKNPGDVIKYEYDPGDGWLHTITLKACYPDDTSIAVVCLDAERSCPPEDCGGITGYYDILRILDHFGTEEYNEMMVWLDGWHPENIILGNINRRLKKFSK